MIGRIDIAGVHTELDEDLVKYARKKIGKLDRFMSRHVKDSAHAAIKLKESKAKDKKKCTCEVIMMLPGEKFVVTETTMNMYAAIDIVEAKLKNRLKKYKEQKDSPRAGSKDRKVRKIFGKILSR